jgi:hypothetical protein
MTMYLDIKQKKALSHRAEHEPIHRASGSKTRWKYLAECKAKSQKGANDRRRQIVVLANTTCSCSCHKPQLLHKLAVMCSQHVLKLEVGTGVGMCLGTT